MRVSHSQAVIHTLQVQITRKSSRERKVGFRLNEVTRCHVYRIICESGSRDFARNLSGMNLDFLNLRSTSSTLLHTLIQICIRDGFDVTGARPSIPKILGNSRNPGIDLVALLKPPRHAVDCFADIERPVMARTCVGV